MKPLLLLFFLIPLCGAAQHTKTDSLAKRIANEKDPDIKVDLFYKLGTEYVNMGNFNEAIKTYQQLIKYSSQQKLTKIIPAAYNEIGNAHADLGNNSAAFSAYRRALKVAQPADLSLKAKINKNIGAVFLSWKNLPVALNYYDEALQLAVLAKDKLTEADCLNNKGTVYEQQSEFKKAFEVYQAALAIYKEQKSDYRIALTYNNLAILLKSGKQLKEAAENYKQSVLYADKADNAWLTAAISNNLGNLLSEMDNTGESSKYLTKALTISRKIDAKELIYESLENLAENASRTGDHALAYKYHKEFSDAKNEFINLESTKEVNRLQTEFETEKKEKALLESRTAYLQSKLEVSKKNNLLIYSLAGLLLVVCGSILIYITFRNRQKRLRAESALNLELANAQALNQLQEEKLRISRELHDNIGSQLTFINSSIQGLSSSTDTDLEVLSETRKLAQHTIAELRRTVWLINKEEVHLEEFVIKLRDYIRPFTLANADTTVNISSSGNCVLNSASATNLFRIIQESVNNAIKYAQATNLQLNLTCKDNHLHVDISDNGLGFNISSISDGFGLKNIQVRAQALKGECIINSVVGEGTSIHINFPFKYA